MRTAGGLKKGFTLVELLVVIAIIGLLSSVAVVAVAPARAKARDANRVANIRQLQNALLLYYEANGSYINSVSWQHDCDGYSGFATALSPLVSGGFMSKIPMDPSAPANPWPQCYYYQANNTCAGTDVVVHPYILIFRTETANLNYTSWGGEPNRWCVYPVS